MIRRPVNDKVDAHFFSKEGATHAPDDWHYLLSSQGNRTDIPLAKSCANFNGIDNAISLEKVGNNGGWTIGFQIYLTSSIPQDILFNYEFPVVNINQGAQEITLGLGSVFEPASAVPVYKIIPINLNGKYIPLHTWVSLIFVKHSLEALIYVDGLRAGQIEFPRGDFIFNKIAPTSNCKMHQLFYFLGTSFNASEYNLDMAQYKFDYTPTNQWHFEENGGSTAYDSGSDYGSYGIDRSNNHGNIQGDLTNFWYQGADVPHSFANALGYNILEGFVIKIQTDIEGTPSETHRQFIIPTHGDGYNYSVEYDGKQLTNQTGDALLEFDEAGIYNVIIKGDFPRIYFKAQGTNDATNKLKLLDIIQWGDNAWTSMNGAFKECANLNLSASDVPNLSSVYEMQQTFYKTNLSNVNPAINNWDVSSVRYFNELFGQSQFNQAIGNWDVSSVRYFFAMFDDTPFNQPLNQWDTRMVQNMSYMFRSTPFDQNIGSWNISSIAANNSLVKMFFHSELSQENYDALLIGWEAQEENPGIIFHAGTSKYTLGGEAEAARLALVANGWQITDGGGV